MTGDGRPLVGTHQRDFHATCIPGVGPAEILKDFWRSDNAAKRTDFISVQIRRKSSNVLSEVRPLGILNGLRKPAAPQARGPVRLARSIVGPAHQRDSFAVDTHTTDPEM